MGWGEEQSWNAPEIYLADERALVYSLESAYAPKPKGGRAAKRAHEAAAIEAEMSAADGDSAVGTPNEEDQD